MGELKRYYLLWSAALLGIAADLFFYPKGFSENLGLDFNLYYTSWASVYFILLLFIYLIVYKKIATNVNDYTPIAMFLLGINKLYDEFYGNPTKLQLNELLFTFCIISFGLYRQRLIKRDTNRAGEAAANDSSGINSRNT